MPPLLEFRSVSYCIGQRTILREVSLAVEEGETVVLLGRSGSGKTTLLKMANALLQPAGGEIRFQGKPLREWDPIQLRRRIGYVIQETGLFPHYSVEDNVALVPRLEKWDPARIRTRVEELLTQVGLPPADFASRFPRQLSGGQRQRVGVARALAADPPLMLLDEPFGALDPINRLDLQKQFVALRQSYRKAALFVTHDIREALLVASRIGLMKDGRLEFIETPARFLQATGDEARAFLAALDPHPVLENPRPEITRPEIGR